MLADLLSRWIARTRGVTFRLDPAIPDLYLLRLSAGYALRRFRGLLAFPRAKGRIFVGRRCALIGRRRMYTDGILNIGDECIVNAVSRDGIRFGNNVSLQRGVVIELTGSLQNLGAGVTIGKNVGIGSGSFIGGAGGVAIGDDTIVGNFVSFHSENHVFTDPDAPIRAQGTIRSGISIGRDCWVGAKATILDGATVGAGSIVAAGAVVKAGSYPEFAILGGVPARVIGTRRAGRERLEDAHGEVDESRRQ